MNLQDNLIKLRKQKGFSQEELAYQLGVSRQSVSKWESGISTPELDRLVEIANLYEVSLDELVRGQEPVKQEYYISDEQITRVVKKAHDYEFKSNISICGLPLVHVNFGRGQKVAKGIFAFGNTAIGLFAFGGISIGVIASGGIGIGILSLAGAALGALAIGGVAVGIISIGGLALGMYTVGGLSIASHVAIGGKAIGNISIGSSPTGQYVVQTSHAVTSQEVYDAIVKLPVSVPNWLKDFLFFIK